MLMKGNPLTSGSFEDNGSYLERSIRLTNTLNTPTPTPVSLKDSMAVKINRNMTSGDLRVKCRN